MIGQPTSTGIAPRYDSAYGRWSRLGHYYAMFPVEFVQTVAASLTRPGDLVIDPFAGRGTVPYVASTMGRIGLGIDINALGWVYGAVKLHPADEASVLRRLHDIDAAGAGRSDTSDPPNEFFSAAFSPKVLRFLDSARTLLNWRQDPTDRTLMALIANYLHGKLGESLSNQMRQTKSMAPDYAVRWWKSHDMQPPDLDPVVFLEKRVAWRYAKGVSSIPEASQMYLGDSTTLLRSAVERTGQRATLALTSPPYSNVTNYVYDQWLRLWLLGGPARPVSDSSSGGKYSNRPKYAELLLSVLSSVQSLIEPDGVVYIRTDAREFTRDATIAALRTAFPSWSLWSASRPIHKLSQTGLFGDRTQKPGEVDLVAVDLHANSAAIARLNSSELGSFDLVG